MEQKSSQASVDAWLGFYPPVELFVVTLSGREVARLSLSGASTVLTVKKVVAPKMSRSFYQLRLVLGNASLDDEVLLGNLPAESQSEPLQVTVFELPYSQDPMAVQQLIEAAAAGKLPELEEALRVPVSPDAEYGEEIARTAMQFAAIHNQEVVIKLLYEAGASLNKGTTTPLTLAVWGHNSHPSFQALQMLCDLGADKEKASPASDEHSCAEVVTIGEFVTPLVAAVCLYRQFGEPDTRIVRILLDAGADVNQTLSDGKPLLWKPLLFGGPHNLDAADALRVAGAAPLPISLMGKLVWQNRNFIMPFVIVLVGLCVVFDMLTTCQRARATVEAILGLFPGAIAVGSVWAFIRMLVSNECTILLPILGTCFASITVALELAAASDFVHCWINQSAIWNILTLPVMLPAVMPILGAVCVCVYFIRLCIQLLNGEGPDDVVDARNKGAAGICITPVSISLGWFMCPGLVWVGSMFHTAILILGCAVSLVGVLLCQHFGSFRLLPHAGSSLAASCCSHGYRASAPRNLQESLLSA